MALARTPRRDARETSGDELVVRRFVEGATVGAHGARVVPEAELIELRGPGDVPRPLLRRPGVLREPLDRVAQRARFAVVLDDPRDLLGRHRVAGVERARLLE